jgi:hypothetical protein
MLRKTLIPFATSAMLGVAAIAANAAPPVPFAGLAPLVFPVPHGLRGLQGGVHGFPGALRRQWLRLVRAPPLGTLWRLCLCKR